MANNYIIRFKHYLLLIIVVLFNSTINAQLQVIHPPGNASTSNDSKPLGVFFGYERSDMIYTSAEHTMGNGSVITDLAFFLESKNASPPPFAYNIKVYLKEVGTTSTVTAQPFATSISGAILVYDGLVPANWLTQGVGQWINITLQTPFNGFTGGNLRVMVETNWAGSASTGFDLNGWWPSPGAFDAILFRHHVKVGGAQYWNQDNTPPVNNGNIPFNNNRPNIRFTYTPATPCVGPPPVGTVTTTASSNPVCAVPFSLGLSNLPAQSGFTFQWFSNATGPFLPIPGATTPFYTITQTVATTYYCQITCGSSTNSVPLLVNQNTFTNCYCTSSATSTADTDIGGVTFGAMANLPNGGCSPVTNNSFAVNTYTDFTATVPSQTYNQGISYPISVCQITQLGSFFSAYVNVFIDYNRDGVFDPVTERVFSAGSTSVGSPTVSGSITIPFSTGVGRTRMRVILRENGNNTQSPCGTYTWGETEDYEISLALGTPCSGLTAGNAVSSQSSVCNNQSFTLSISGNTTLGSGQTWQWQKDSACLGNWVNIFGATLNTYTTSQSYKNCYRCIITCPPCCGATTATTVPVTVNQNPSQLCYCNPTNTATTLHTVNCSGAFISNVSLNTLNNSTACASANGLAYNVFPQAGATTTIVKQGDSYNLGVSTSGGSQSISVWIDYNKNGTFETTEWIPLTNNPPQMLAAGTYTVPVSIPTGLGATSFATGMRVRSRQNSGVNNDADDACTTFLSGETEDYFITIDPIILPVCPGALTSNAIASSNMNPCSGGSITLSVTPNPSINFQGYTYVWQFDTSTVGGVWLNLPGAANAPSIVTSQARYTRYRCVITCIAGGTYTTAQLIIANRPDIWLGFSSQWTDGANWCGRVPTPSDSVLIDLVASGRPAASYFAPIVSSGTSATAFNINVAFGDTLTVLTDASNSFAVTQHIVNNGVINFSSTKADTIAYGTGSSVSPLWSPFRNVKRQRSQFIYLATELSSNGLQANDVIDSLFFHFRQRQSTTPYEAFSISYAQVPTTTFEFTTPTPIGGLTQIYSNANLNLATLIPGASGTLRLPVTPFIWDGVSNIVLQVCYNFTTTFTPAGSDYLYLTSTGLRRSYLQLSSAVTGVSGCTMDITSPGSVSSTFTPTSNRPNITFRFHRPQLPLTATVGSLVLGGGIKNNGSGAKLFISYTNLTVNGSLNNDGSIGVDFSNVFISPSPGNTGDFLNNGTKDLAYSPAGFLRKSNIYFNGINWMNNGVLNPGTSSRVVFGGTLNQTIGGTAPSTFWDLRMEKSAATQSITLNQPIIVNDSLALNNGKILMNQKTITINNPAITGIVKLTPAATVSGVLVSEDTLSKVNWAIGTNTGVHSIPFTDIPVTHNIPFIITNSAGDVGTVTIATYPTNGANLPYPPGVDHINQSVVGTNDSLQTVNRFWVLGKTGPSGTSSLTFNFSDVERGGLPQANSTMTAANPGRAQPWGQAGGWRTAPGTQTYLFTSPFGSLPMPAYHVARINTVTVNGYTWNFGQSNPWAVATSSNPLPIQLVNFTAKGIDDHVKLNWITASEENNDYFTVQRTTDFNSHVEVARVPSQGNSNDLQYYEAWDLNPIKAVNYYRLLQTDMGGTAEPVSEYIAVRFGSKSKFEIINIVNETDVQVIFDYDSDLPVDYVVTDMVGKTVASATNNPAQVGVNILKLDASTWQHGMYLITLQNTDKVVTRKMVY